MARLTKQAVETRETYVRDLFRQNPTLSGAEVQTKLKEGFGKMMRPNRIYELKREVAADLAAVVPATTTTLTTTEVAPTGSVLNLPAVTA